MITLLNVLAAAIPVRERVVTIEDVAELRLPGPHVVRLEGRPPNVEGRGEVPLRELVRNALRMRPDRIVVGEVRGPEVLDMLQAANTGHRGLMTTLHAGSPEEVPARLEAMALAAPGAGLDVVRRLEAAVASAPSSTWSVPPAAAPCAGSPPWPSSPRAATVEPGPSHCAPPAPPTASPRPATSPTGPTASTPRSCSPSNQPTSPDGSASSVPGAAPDDRTAARRRRPPAVAADGSGRHSQGWVLLPEARVAVD
jgi:hypothetical protein